METKTKFLFDGAIDAPTPKWATYSFRTIIIFTTVLMGIVAGTGLIDEGWKVEIISILKGVDMLAWSLSRMLGVVIERE